MITVSVPTHSFLKKYVDHRANCQDGFINATTTTAYGIHLIKVLQKKASWEPKEKLREFDSFLKFRISEFFYTREGFYITRQNIIFFNQVLKSEFEEALFDFITINVNRDFKTTIEQETKVYLRLFGITESEKSLDSLLKAYQRWRAERNYMIIKL